MSKLRVLASVVVLAAAGRSFGAEAATAPAAGTETLSAAVRQALGELSSEDFKTREGALGKLELALGTQMKSLMSASEDPEVQSRLTALLQFNEGLTRWVLETQKLPAEQRKKQLEFGLKPELLPLIGSVYSHDAEKRLEGVHGLAKIDTAESTELLARLLDDPERAVYVAAMEAVWDRKPTDAVVDALWVRAVDSGFTGYRQQADPRGQAQNLTFRGKAIGASQAYFNQAWLKGQDAGIAGEVLINLKAPQVNEKLKTFMESLEKLIKTYPYVLNNNTEQMKNVMRLVEIYKTKEAVQIMYRIGTGPVIQRFGAGQLQVNNEKYFWTSRTGVLATVIAATDQKVEDYQLKHVPQQMGGMWATTSEDDETKAIKKLQEWMAVNGEAWGLKAEAEAAVRAAEEGAATQGAPVKPAAGAGGMQGGVQVMPMIQGNIQIQGGVMIQGNVMIQGGAEAATTQEGAATRKGAVER